MGYDSVNRPVLEQVPPGARSVLDLGCGGGAMGEVLKSARGCSVVGVTFDEDEAAQARRRLDRVEVLDLNACDPAGLGTFDCVLCSHVLGHLLHPERLLRGLRQCLGPGGTLVVALPNILFWKQRLEFARGRFRYADGGLMDRTHYRFYDWSSAAELLTGSGYIIRHRAADGGWPLSRFLGRRAGGQLDRLATRWLPGLFGWQFVFRCQPADVPPPGQAAVAPAGS